ncbi:MAG TPA: thioesterase family protein [Solirubrobacterales bacterium]|nr:thioesterase family protein [Solirubrobacterales bacterium]
MPDSFYEQAGDGYLATELTRGPWDPGAQHAGPPAALLGRELELLPDAEDFHLARITYEILRSVPIGPVEVAARVLRPGRRVQLAEATLSVEGEVLVRASAWRIRRSQLDVPAEAMVTPRPPAPPSSDEPAEFFPTEQEHGYHTGMEVTFVSGAFMEPGPAGVWLRMRRPLVAGEEPTPLQRVLIAADVGNGVSSTLDYRRYLFINVELTVHLERLPAGEWVHLEAETHPQPIGVGTAESVLSDRDGRIGRAAQSLLIAER